VVKLKALERAVASGIRAKAGLFTVTILGEFLAIGTAPKIVEIRAD
jgi:hypothetical protein